MAYLRNLIILLLFSLGISSSAQVSKPEIVPLDSNEILDLYNHSLAEWREAERTFNSSAISLEAMLKPFANDELKKKDLKSLVENFRDSYNFELFRSLRVKAQEVRGLYAFLDEEHKIPPTLQGYVSVMGDFKDAVYSDNPLEVQHRAQQALDFLSRRRTSYDSWVTQFSPCTTKSLEAYMLKNLSEIMYLSGKQRLRAETYHDLRKLLRGFLDFFNVLSEHFDTNTFDDVTVVLKRASRKMGKVHDSLIQDAMEVGKRKSSIRKVKLKVPGRAVTAANYLLTVFSEVSDRLEAVNFGHGLCESLFIN